MPASDLAPVCLGPNFVYHVAEYRGGGEIARFRGIEPVEHNSPEDWVGSATTRYQHASEGLTTLPDGQYLRDAIEKDPEGYLGPEHLARFGPNPGVLIKLIDSARRLVVHLHPDDDFARRHLGCDFGKTEAWVVLATVGDGAVWLGFTREVGEQELAQWRAEQAVDEMLATLHRVPVQAGAAILVPAGVPHAIGPGSSCSSSRNRPTSGSPWSSGPVALATWDWVPKWHLRPLTGAHGARTACGASWDEG